MNRLAAVTVLAVASLAVAAPAFASKGHEKPAVCHPTGKGWVLINPSQASSHIDESAYPNGRYWKHEHDGRHDVYAVAGVCPSVPSPTSTGSPTSTPTTTQPTSTPSTDTHTTQTTSPSQSQTSSTPGPPTSTQVTTAPTTTTSTFSVEPPKPSARPTGTSGASSTPTGTSPRRSGPSSTVAPPEELAFTGFNWVVVFAAGLLLLVGGLFHAAGRVARKGGRH